VAGPRRTRPPTAPAGRGGGASVSAAGWGWLAVTTILAAYAAAGWAIGRTPPDKFDITTDTEDQ
jgi:hypothetical protein